MKRSRSAAGSRFYLFPSLYPLSLLEIYFGVIRFVAIPSKASKAFLVWFCLGSGRGRPLLPQVSSYSCCIEDGRPPIPPRLAVDLLEGRARRERPRGPFSPVFLVLRLSPPPLSACSFAAMFFRVFLKTLDLSSSGVWTRTCCLEQ